MLTLERNKMLLLLLSTAEPEAPASSDAAAAGTEEKAEQKVVADMGNPATTGGYDNSTPPSTTDLRSLREDHAIRTAMETLIGKQISVICKTTRDPL